MTVINPVLFSQVSVWAALDDSQLGKSVFRGNRVRKRISQTLTRVQVEYQNICQELEDDEGFHDWNCSQFWRVSKLISSDVLDTGCVCDDETHGTFVGHFHKDVQERIIEQDLVGAHPESFVCAHPSNKELDLATKESLLIEIDWLRSAIQDRKEHLASQHQQYIVQDSK